MASRGPLIYLGDCYFCEKRIETTTIEIINKYEIVVDYVGNIAVCRMCKHEISYNYIYLKEKTQATSRRLVSKCFDEESEEDKKNHDPPWENDYGKYEELYFTLRVKWCDYMLDRKTAHIVFLQNEILQLHKHKRKAIELENKIKGQDNHKITNFLKPDKEEGE